MTVKLYTDWATEHYTFHILPSLSVYVTGYLSQISFSWIIWTIEFRFWDDCAK